MLVRVGTEFTAPAGTAAASVPAVSRVTTRSARLSGLDMVGLLAERTDGSPSAGSTGDARFVRCVARWEGFDGSSVTRLRRTCQPPSPRIREKIVPSAVVEYTSCESDVRSWPGNSLVLLANACCASITAPAEP